MPLLLLESLQVTEHGDHAENPMTHALGVGVGVGVGVGDVVQSRATTHGRDSSSSASSVASSHARPPCAATDTGAPSATTMRVW
jgi:hypothetical protein